MASTAFRTRVLSSSRLELKKFRSRFPASGDPRLVVELAGEGKALITQRTAAGIGSGNKPFAAYKPGPYRASVGRRPAGYPTPSGGSPSKSGKTVLYGSYGEYKSAIGRGAKPQLSISGGMLGAISIATVSSREAHLFFSSREEAAKAHGHETGTTTTKRPFFDLSDFDSQDAMRTEMLKYMTRAAKASKLRLHGGRPG